MLTSAVVLRTRTSPFRSDVHLPVAVLVFAIGTLASAVSEARTPVPLGAPPQTPVRARLVYTADDPKGVCASEADFRGKVSARLGYDPFRDDASWVFRIRFDARSKRPRAEIATEQNGAPSGKRTLDDASCDALSETVASAIAIAIDPLARSSDRSEPPTLPPSSAQPSPPPPAPVKSASEEVPPPASHAPIVPLVFLDGTVSFGRAAGVALGGRAGFGFAYRALSAAVEVRGEATPGSVQLSPLDRTSWSVFSGGLAVCGHKSLLELCAVGAVGTLQAKAEDVSRPSLKGTLFGVVGPRVGALVPITDDVGVRANAELGIPLVRTTFYIDGTAAWTAPAVQGSLGLGLEVRFR